MDTKTALRMLVRAGASVDRKRKHVTVTLPNGKVYRFHHGSRRNKREDYRARRAVREATEDAG